MKQMAIQSERDLLSQLPVDAIFELEDLLYEPRFLGVPMGATLADLLLSMFRTSTRFSGQTEALRARLGWWRFCMLGMRHADTLPRLETGRLLLTWLADTPRLNDFVLPVIAELGPRNCNVIGGTPSIRQRLLHETGFCTRYQVTATARSAWQPEYARCRTVWHRRIRLWLDQHHLPHCLFPHLAFALAVRSFYVAGFFRFLDLVQPRAVVTDSEHNFPWSSLVLAARQLGIPTLQMIHGVLDPPFAAAPLLSNVALCWGEQQREQMVELGTSPDRLVVTGCQRLAPKVNVDGRAVRVRLGLPVEGAVVMLATNPMPRAQWRRLTFTFGEAFQGQPGVTGAVRLHPSEARKHFQCEIQRYPDICFLENRQWTVEEAMAACDVVVVYNSGLGNDALVMGRPVVLLDVLAWAQNNGRTLADRAGCPVVRTAADLRLVVGRILGDSAYRDGLKNQAEAYVKWFCAAFGQEAARNVADEVRRRAR